MYSIIEKSPSLSLLFNLVAKEIRVRYMGATIGFVWSLGNPIATATTYYIVFTYLLPSNDSRFALHLVTGVFHWMLVSQIIQQSCDWLLNNANLLRKIYFPRILIPFSGVLTVCVFWFITMLVYFASFKILGGIFTAALLWYPLIIIDLILFLCGIGLILSVAQVRFRDMRHLIDVVMPLLFWLTPIVWSIRSVPSNVLNYLSLNPLFPYFRAFDSIFYLGIAPTKEILALATTYSCASLLIGVLVFRHADDVVEFL
jgi:lipopolysaccharide transport system permease protein